MQRLNGYIFYQLGYQLKPLETIQEGKKLKDVSSIIYFAKVWLDWFLADKVVPIAFSKETGYNLSKALEKSSCQMLWKFLPAYLPFSSSHLPAQASFLDGECHL